MSLFLFVVSLVSLTETGSSVLLMLLMFFHEGFYDDFQSL